MAAYLEEKKDAVALKDLCGTMWVHRSRFKFRKAFIAPTAAAMAQQLAAFAKSGSVKPSGEGRKMQVAYVFTGQGSQYPGVGKSLMGFPVYKEAVEAVDKLFKVRVVGGFEKRRKGEGGESVNLTHGWEGLHPLFSDPNARTHTVYVCV
jgi:acyl transferase domain-containing protein